MKRGPKIKQLRKHKKRSCFYFAKILIVGYEDNERK